MTNYSRRLREFGWLSFANQFALVGNLIALALLAQSVGASELGRVAFAQSIAAVVLTVLDIRFEDALQRYMPIVESRYGAISSSRIFTRTLAMDAAFGAIVAVAGIALISTAVEPSDLVNPNYLMITMAAAGSGTAIGTLNAGLAVRGRLIVVAKIGMAGSAASAVLCSVGVLLAGGTGYLLGQLASVLIQVLLSGWANRADFVNPLGARMPKGFSSFLATSSAGSSLAVGAEPGVLALSGILGGPTFVGLLKVALAPARVVASIVSPIAVQAFPSMAQSAASLDYDAIRREARYLGRLVVGPGVVIILLALPLMDPAVRLIYGDEFSVAALPAVILLFGAVARSCVAWSKVLPLAIGRPGLRLQIVGLESVLLLAGVVAASRIDDQQAGLAVYAVVSAFTALALAAFWWSVANSISKWKGGETAK